MEGLPPKSESLTIVVTGSGSGFGALTARTLTGSGHRVYAGLLEDRNTSPAVYEQAEAFATEKKVQLRGIQLDVSDDESIRRAVDTIVAAEGGVDVVVHNAGHMNWGPTEAFSAEQFHKVLEVNCVGCHRVNCAVLPHMRRAGRGLLVWVSSGSVYGANAPFLGPYFAAKAAMDSLAQTYQVELTPFGIETCIVVPGIFTTGTRHFETAMKPANEALAKQLLSTPSPLAGWDTVSAEGSAKATTPDADPQAVADAIVRVVNQTHGSRPFRTYVEFDGGQTNISAGAHDLVRERYLNKFGTGELLKVKLNTR
ncbi:hypothetical protein H2200_012811 [Cladophialophora chaetospira]|uniref:Cytochrome c domain-containing protein n=1 Tax=Cladophialophora chaetospira TaxID=386627 RepID=A0AA38WWV4_9EURO|nr:hypothetical protein H2200_012811 [Cladophialophora chaetospira]